MKIVTLPLAVAELIYTCLDQAKFDNSSGQSAAGLAKRMLYTNIKYAKENPPKEETEDRSVKG